MINNTTLNRTDAIEKYPTTMSFRQLSLNRFGTVIILMYCCMYTSFKNILTSLTFVILYKFNFNLLSLLLHK